MLPEKQALRKKEKIITWLIAIAVAVALIISFFVVIKKQMTVPEKSNQNNQMLLDIKYWLFREGYTTPVVTIENMQDITRNNCNATINSKYIFKVGEILPISASQSIITVNTNDFVRNDGVLYDSIANPPRSICIICAEPVYNTYCGNFAR